MIRAVQITLISESPEAHGVFDTTTEVSTNVFAEVRSVRESEFWRAKEAGIEPTIVFRLTNYADYDNQKIVVWDDVRYRVMRTYVQNDAIELTCGEITNDR